VILRVADSVQLTDTGRERRSNEDNAFSRPPLFAVADGMGGARAGEVASGIVVETLEKGMPDDVGPEEGLAGLTREANQRIHRKATSDEERAGMGTTLTAAYVGDDEVAFAHVGDSRAYRFRDGKLEQLTNDHSLVGELVRRGKLTERQAEEHPQRSVITRALGPEAAVEVDSFSVDARPGDVFLLCSDGLTSMVEADSIADILRQHDSMTTPRAVLSTRPTRTGGATTSRSSFSASRACPRRATRRPSSRRSWARRRRRPRRFSPPWRRLPRPRPRPSAHRAGRRRCPRAPRPRRRASHAGRAGSRRCWRCSRSSC